ncbi:putative cytidine deaminase [Porphyridium purpureum]|uniref:cytidine deaminase n=1 Tax=Porphyridium purpureum TaxID=35688 RepID=A0A5J4ZAV2_PORPP|nr:putative cytidine deaminase [Porphyridium purpureum]|eukprot:POR8432..scf295_1
MSPRQVQVEEGTILLEQPHSQLCQGRLRSMAFVLADCASRVDTHWRGAGASACAREKKLRFDRSASRRRKRSAGTGTVCALMEQFEVESVSRTRSRVLSDEKVLELARSACAALAHAYAPYSQFRVGAALLAAATDDLDAQFETVSGCNVENASYGLCVCAERTAVFKAVSRGLRTFTAIAVTTDLPDQFTAPCGACRQVLSEFGDMEVFLVQPNLRTRHTFLSDLLPMAFDGSFRADRPRLNRPALLQASPFCQRRHKASERPLSLPVAPTAECRASVEQMPSSTREKSHKAPKDSKTKSRRKTAAASPSLVGGTAIQNADAGSDADDQRQILPSSATVSCGSSVPQFRHRRWVKILAGLVCVILIGPLLSSMIVLNKNAWMDQFHSQVGTRWLESAHAILTYASMLRSPPNDGLPQDQGSTYAALDSKTPAENASPSPQATKSAATPVASPASFTTAPDVVAIPHVAAEQVLPPPGSIEIFEIPILTQKADELKVTVCRVFGAALVAREPILLPNELKDSLRQEQERCGWRRKVFQDASRSAIQWNYSDVLDPTKPLPPFTTPQGDTNASQLHEAAPQGLGEGLKTSSLDILADAEVVRHHMPHFMQDFIPVLMLLEPLLDAMEGSTVSYRCITPTGGDCVRIPLRPAIFLDDGARSQGPLSWVRRFLQNSPPAEFGVAAVYVSSRKELQRPAIGARSILTFPRKTLDVFGAISKSGRVFRSNGLSAEPRKQCPAIVRIVNRPPAFYRYRKGGRNLNQTAEWNSTLLELAQHQSIAMEVQETFFEDLTYEEQLHAMQETDFLVIGHGAAATNAIFVRDNVPVLEIFPFLYQPNLFEKMVKQVGTESRYFLMDAEPDLRSVRECLRMMGTTDVGMKTRQQDFVAKFASIAEKYAVSPSRTINNDKAVDWTVDGSRMCVRSQQLTLPNSLVQRMVNLILDDPNIQRCKRQ